VSHCDGGVLRLQVNPAQQSAVLRHWYLLPPLLQAQVPLLQ
jgi:hypothetical protein